MQQPLFVFIHMTKTAGGSLRYAIEDLSRDDVIVSNLVAEAEAIPSPKLMKTKLLFGHLRYGLDLKTDRDLKYLTYLRHPITRVISHYYQLFKVDKSHVGDKIREYPEINEFFRKSYHREFSNLMTKIITDTADDVMEDEERFELAKKIIERDFAYVGVQELFDLSLVSLSHVLNLKIEIAKNYNSGSWKIGDVNRMTLDTIIKSNQADMMLYRHVLDKVLVDHGSLKGLLHHD